MQTHGLACFGGGLTCLRVYFLRDIQLLEDGLARMKGRMKSEGRTYRLRQSFEGKHFASLKEIEWMGQGGFSRDMKQINVGVQRVDLYESQVNS